MMKTLAAIAAVATLALAPPAFAASRDAAILAQDDNNSAHVARYDSLLNRLRRDAARRGARSRASP